MRDRRRLAEPRIAVLTQAIDDQIADLGRVRDACESAHVTAPAVLSVTAAPRRLHFDVGNPQEEL